MSREASALLAFGAIVVAVLVAAAAGAFSTRATSTSAPVGGPIPEPPSDGSYGVVYELRASAGMSIFGLKLHLSSHIALIGMVVPAECIGMNESGQETLLTEGICSHLPAHGELSGGGTTATGEKLVVVSIKVSDDCYQALTIGNPWPPDAKACRQEASTPG